MHLVDSDILGTSADALDREAITCDRVTVQLRRR